MLHRDEQIKRIKPAIRAAMEAPEVDTSSIRQFLDDLSNNTPDGEKHRFGTTNWDYLLQQEILFRSHRDWDKVQPTWLAESHVSHLNGSAEELENNENRSPFLLEEDSYNRRTWSVEANMFYNYMIWNRRFVVVGMSFECETDRFLLNALGKVEDDLPIGKSTWLIVNRNANVLEKSSDAIKGNLPRAKIIPILCDFTTWQEHSYPKLWSVM